MERAGTVGLTPQNRRGGGCLTKHNSDDEVEGEVDSNTVKYLGVLKRQWALGGKGWGGTY